MATALNGFVLKQFKNPFFCFFSFFGGWGGGEQEDL